MGNRWVAVLDKWLHEVAVLWGAEDYSTFCMLTVMGKWLLCLGGSYTQNDK